MTNKYIKITCLGIIFVLLIIGCSNSPQSTKDQPSIPPTITEKKTQTNESIKILLTVPISSATTQNTKEVTPKLDYYDMQVSSVDGMKMIFIPAGEFLMGSEKGVGDDDEEPEHPVKSKGFWIDQIEVTNGMYVKCVDAGVCSAPRTNSSYSHNDYFGTTEFLDFPVINVNWYQAKKYCQWAGRRLPTEAEWEMAARGIENFTYPWGNNSPDLFFANFGYGSSDVVKCGSYPSGASPYGVLDMAGNVAEWVSDWYDVYPLYTDPNPQGPASGKYHILRGGSWILGEYMIRSAERYWVSAYFVDEDTGFRCAVSK